MLSLFQYLRFVVQRLISRFLLTWRPVKSKPAKPTISANFVNRGPGLIYHWQAGLERLGFGSQNAIYHVDGHIILKGPQTFFQPTSEAPSSLLWEYAFETLHGYMWMRDELIVSRACRERDHFRILEHTRRLKLGRVWLSTPRTCHSYWQHRPSSNNISGAPASSAPKPRRAH